MFSTNVPKGLFLASHTLYPLDDPEAVPNNFLRRWGEYTPRNLRRVFQAEEASKHDKMLLLYALGYLIEPEATDILLSSLQSKERSEQWVSALSLGRQKQEGVFELLQKILLEELLDFNFDLTRNDTSHDEKDWIYDKDWYIGRATLSGERAQNSNQVCAQIQMPSPVNGVLPVYNALSGNHFCFRRLGKYRRCTCPA